MTRWHSPWPRISRWAQASTWWPRSRVPPMPRSSSPRSVCGAASMTISSRIRRRIGNRCARVASLRPAPAAAGLRSAPGRTATDALLRGSLIGNPRQDARSGCRCGSEAAVRSLAKQTRCDSRLAEADLARASSLAMPTRRRGKRCTLRPRPQPARSSARRCTSSSAPRRMPSWRAAR